jgi:L-iditol 2-dehydrogenase
MKALVLEEYNRFTYEEVPDPQPGPGEVMVQVKACGICGSDIHGMDGSTGRRIPPSIMGHEASGIVHAFGSGVTGWQVGDRVTFDSTISCGQCYFCRRGLINLCDNRRVMGVSCTEYRQDGAFAEYVILPQHILYRLPEALPFEEAAMVEPLSVAFHAVNRVPLSINDSAVVVGAGMVGLLVIQALRLAGCGQVIAVDVDQDRLDLACQLGADVGLRSDQLDIPAKVAQLTSGRGADVGFEVVGISPTVKTALASLRKGGSLGLVGNLSASVEFPLQSAVTRQITLFSSCASAGEYPACLDMLARKSVDVRPLISAVSPLSEGNAWFQRLYHHETGLMKVILTP